MIGSEDDGAVQPTVLIVDDSKLARMVVAKALGRLRPNWTHVEAGNADEALARAQAQQQGFDVGLRYGTMKVDGAKIVVKVCNDAGGASGVPDTVAAVTTATNAIENDRIQILQCCAPSTGAIIRANSSLERSTRA